MKFKDRNGKEYIFRPTALNIIHAEKRSGDRLLAGIFAATEAQTEAEMADLLFGSTERFCCILYECSVPLEDQSKIDFDSFCDSFDLKGLLLVMGEITPVLFESMEPPGGSAIRSDGLKDSPEKKREVGDAVTSGT